MHTVSVIMPCFNMGQYIDEAVDSVLAQTYNDIEIIIVDDGSTDPYTKEHLAGYDRPRTKVITTPNQGVSAARNTAIRNANGAYILPLDPDDRIAPSYVDKAVAVLEAQPDVKIAYCDGEFFGNRSGRWDLPPFSLDRILIRNMICNSALFRRKDFDKTGGYNPNMEHNLEDWDLWLSLLETGGTAYKIPEVLFYYRIKDAEVSRSLSTTKEQREHLNEQIVRNHAALYRRRLIAMQSQLAALQEAGELAEAYRRQVEHDRSFRESWSYRLGHFLLAPGRWIKGLFQ